MNIPKMVKDIRKAKKWSQKDLAKHCGVSHRTVENWEQARTNVSAPALKILKQLNQQIEGNA